MKKLFIIILGFFIIMACSDPGSSDNEGKTKEYSILLSNPNAIFNELNAFVIINRDGTGLKKIGHGLEFIPGYGYSVSNDGSKIVYLIRSEYSSSPKINVSDVKTQSDQILMNMEMALSPKVSPDGLYIAYMQNQAIGIPEDSTGLCVMKIDGSDIKVLLPQIFPNNFNWSADSKGIIYADGCSSTADPVPAYYIDKDGLNDPVEVENPCNYDDIEKPNYYSLQDFTRAGIPDIYEPDSIYLYSSNFNKQKNKAWYEYDVRKFRPVLVWRSYLLGYDFELKKESFLIDTSQVMFGTTVLWSPDGLNISVLTANGLFAVDVEGNGNKILEYTIDASDIRMIISSWIPRTD
ncbi:MAG: hypothetical protein JXR46_05860 [Calditrichaceae bacterium]|nr:hypothetical protein [Calditrichaceae bacterium]MBN2708550.1 hypothetical protein [Calditrichaceae bacterium]RQV96861.1 MAG: hypothetical protein EH224_03125 [Calditrichota bacterium]